MAYRLKKEYEAFTVVDGPFAGKSYDHSTEYETIPPGEKYKFERVSSESGGEKPKGKKASASREEPQ